MIPSPLKIAVSGFPGTGKTTLVKAISERFSLPVINEEMAPIAKAEEIYRRASRHLQAEELPALKKNLIESFLMRDKKRSEAYLVQNAFVADRCEVDLLNWWLVRFGTGRQEVDEVTSFLLKNFQKKMQQFDLIIITPISPPFDRSPNEQGVARKVDFTTHVLSTAVTSGLIQTFSKTRMLHLPRTAGSTEDRLSLVSSALNEMTSQFSKKVQ